MEFRQGFLKNWSADFVAATKLAGIRLGGAMQLSPNKLKKIRIALRLVGRFFQSVGFDAVAHPLQGYPESFLRGLGFEEPNADFVQAIPKCGFDLVQAGRNVGGAGKNQQQWLLTERLHFVEECTCCIWVEIQRMRLVYQNYQAVSGTFLLQYRSKQLFRGALARKGKF